MVSVCYIVTDTLDLWGVRAAVIIGGFILCVDIMWWCVWSCCLEENKKRNLAYTAIVITLAGKKSYIRFIGCNGLCLHHFVNSFNIINCWKKRIYVLKYDCLSPPSPNRLTARPPIRPPARLSVRRPSVRLSVCICVVGNYTFDLFSNFRCNNRYWTGLFCYEPQGQRRSAAGGLVADPRVRHYFCFDRCYVIVSMYHFNTLLGVLWWDCNFLCLNIYQTNTVLDMFYCRFCLFL